MLKKTILRPFAWDRYYFLTVRFSYIIGFELCHYTQFLYRQNKIDFFCFQSTTCQHNAIAAHVSQQDTTFELKFSLLCAPLRFIFRWSPKGSLLYNTCTHILYTTTTIFPPSPFFFIGKYSMSTQHTFRLLFLEIKISGNS